MAVAAEKAYELLKQRVIAGAYAPGAQLKEEHIARELAISRTPIRAALKRLVQDGLATADAGRGVRVSEWTEFDIQETYELRGLLEGHAAELATRRGGAALADRLDELNARMERALAKGGDSMAGQLQEINAQFHRAILEASGSPRLRAMLAGLIDMPIVIRSYFISTRQDLVQSLHHHRDLAAAVRIGDPQLARQVMQLHLKVAAHRFGLRRSEFSGTQWPGATTARRRTAA
ncbi:GntR family transcriptional regulator [Ramlibacter tataouinensis]|uniref:Transcriptional regulator, GntR family-like protein n=1 Tax=Ramlibacter tataouinensis (strain ATCC BAA-407 / DSM 14655 / LMG 21543 / TTB310) TaxID=365046 RepID=F5XZ79_RAMTT|nr:GntR family transcriptional regulator [Ramlibacter tataouinensis]AEG93249.1 transcriptional regulator, GntR family-like protein [Ramlibacter tataouinensis TTB310]